jgi:transcriptional regulator GlxA family with amidase domain
MKIACLVYEGMTALDLIGPYEVLNALPERELVFVGKTAGQTRPDSGAFGIIVDYRLADVTAADILLLPGGVAGTIAAAADPEIAEWVRAVDATTRWSTSVCTGSLLLGAAGLLSGRQATTHWGAVPMLEAYGATYVARRVVEDGKYITAAGVSSGIDMALALVARAVDETTARSIQLAIEYDPQPPFDAGSPAKAGAELVQVVMDRFAAQM